MPADLEVQRGVEVPRVIMNLPQGSGMDDDGQRRATSPSLNGFANRRGNDKLRTAHKNSTGNIALQATGGETNAEPPDPKCSRRILRIYRLTSAARATRKQNFHRITIAEYYSEKPKGTGPVAETSSADIAAAIEALKNPCDLDAILACAASHTDDSSLTPRTGLLHPRFREDVPLIDDLARILADQCVFYALPRRKRLELHEQIKADISKIARTMAIVRDVFVDFNAKHPSRASEVGEVLAYCIAQTRLSAAQMASKMALKTSTNMPVHGLDGVHAKFENNVLTVYFLEAKLASSARIGALRYAKSAAEFSANKKQYNREYQLVGDLGHFDSLEGPARQAALDYFDIWNNPTALPLRERYVGVICHSEPKHFADQLTIDDEAIDIHERHFNKLYAADLDGHRTYANKVITKAGGNPAKSILYFVAVPDIDELRKAFYNAIGLPIPPGPWDDEDDLDDDEVGDDVADTPSPDDMQDGAS